MEGDMKRVMLVAVVGLGLISSGQILAQSNPAVGTWKLNLTKSKYTAAVPVPKSLTRIVEARGDGVNVTYEAVNADGSSTTYGYTANFDGMEYPIYGMNGADTIVLQRINTDTYEGTLKRAGEVVMTVTSTVSRDGTVTVLTYGTGVKNQPTTDRSVFDKQ
jgi:hypothetical protein